MKTYLLSTVAASLLLTVGVASAQSPKEQQAPARAPVAQQSAPAEKIAPPMNAGEKKAPETTGQASPDGKAGAGKSAKDSMNKSPETTGQSPKAADQDKYGSGMKNSSDTKSPAMKGASETNKPDASKGAASDATKTQNNAEGAASTKSSTSGQGAAAGAVKLSTEQRTKIATVIKSQKVERVTPAQLNVSINIGTRIPAHVRLYPLPTEVITIYPEWRGYDYILVGDEIVIINPRTHEIVFIINA